MTELRNIEVNVTEWPVVIVRYGLFDDDEHDAHFNVLEQVLREREGPFAAALDIRRSPPLNPRQRRRTVEFWEKHQDDLAPRVRGLTYVTDKSIMRGVITAPNWFVKYPCPVEVHKSVDESTPWLRELLNVGPAHTPHDG